jgi:hypothetical protein
MKKRAETIMTCCWCLCEGFAREWPIDLLYGRRQNNRRKEQTKKRQIRVQWINRTDFDARG